MPKQTLDNWVRLNEKGQLKGALDILDRIEALHGGQSSSSPTAA